MTNTVIIRLWHVHDHDHRLFEYKFDQYRIRGTVLKLIESYLSTGIQYTCTNIYSVSIHRNNNLKTRSEEKYRWNPRKIYNIIEYLGAV